MATLEELTLKELREMAKEEGIKNWWTLKKVELIDLLDTVEPETEAEIVQVVPEVIEEEPNVNTLDEETTDSEEAPATVKKNQKRLIEYNGKVQTLTAWAKELGIRHQTLYNRIVMKGWDVDRAFETPTKKEVTVNVEEPTVE